MRRARPTGLRVLEAYSPKLDRRLQRFGEASFEQWVRLEADPTIQTFCERPLDLQCENGVLHIDFWVRQGDREILLVMADTCAVRSATVGNIELEIVAIPSAELAASRMWTVNWKRMLMVMTCCRKVVPRTLQQSILKFVDEPMQISRIEREFGIGDPTLVRAAVFNLLHAGELQAPKLHTEELSFLTSIQPIGERS